MAPSLGVAAPERLRCTALELTEGEQQRIAAAIPAAGEEVDVLRLAFTPGSSPGGGALLQQGDEVGDQGLGGGCSRRCQGDVANDKS